jgi:hypothetical protein
MSSSQPTGKTDMGKLIVSPDTLADQLVPVAGYAQQPLPEAFENLEVLLPLLCTADSEDFDVTAFYSKRKSGLSENAAQELAEYNQRAFDLAKDIGGLVFYYQKGGLLTMSEDVVPNPVLGLDFTPDCLSFCIWKTLRQAKAGATLAGHQAASRRVNEWYERFAIKKYMVTVREQELAFEEIRYQA